ncbi:hypothetical protein Vadar_031774 [Vaccinium darrowii]|uniref:Uncharacterized protein n=1 Tax=Vaccinium darrowii TaxID=229202 RepID=A0ACB7XUS2_9ERIC|nr:hypothetical protein Vadar_031774 [Vaccinium darrowii]
MPKRKLSAEEEEDRRQERNKKRREAYTAKKLSLAYGNEEEYSNPSSTQLDDHDKGKKQISRFSIFEIAFNGSIQLTRPIPSSSGRLTNTKPFNFFKPTSFSTDFSFSISPHSGLALLLFPTNFPRKLSPQDLLNSSFAIEFDTSLEDVVSVRASNVSHSKE